MKGSKEIPLSTTDQSMPVFLKKKHRDCNLIDDLTFTLRLLGARH